MVDRCAEIRSAISMVKAVTTEFGGRVLEIEVSSVTVTPPHGLEWFVKKTVNK